MPAPLPPDETRDDPWADVDLAEGQDAEPEEGEDDSGMAPCNAEGSTGDSDSDSDGGLAVALGAEELAALIGRIVHQDQAALTALYDALSGRVYASALRITRQVALAEEVMQDTFWQIWRQAPRFDLQRGSATAWVLNMARSRALDALRGLAREQAHQQQLVQAEIEDLGVDPLDLLADGRRDSRLQQTLAALDPLRRQLIALAYYRGLTQDEIAAQTGMPLGTVKSHLRRTLAALREALAQDAPGTKLGPAA
jgi:RNA polymerase sigma-70 factor (ECF subfamily)